MTDESPNNLRLAFDAGCAKALEKAPRAVGKQFWQMMTKAMAHPELPGLNLERVNGAADRRMRSMRIDQGYRAIALHEGADLLFVHVDEHDKAYRWAERRRAVVDGLTQSVRFVNVVSEEVIAPAPTIDFHQNGLFDAWSDEELAAVGVMPEQRRAVRGIVNEAGIDEAEGALDEILITALTGLAAGLSVAQVREEIGIAETHAVTPSFEQALRSDVSRKRIYIAKDEKELALFANGDLAGWRVFLHPSQRRLAYRGLNGSAMVRGGAGTGKTVVAMHRARHLADVIAKDPGRRGRKVLFTTFTTNLAEDIRANLRTLCPEHVEGPEPVIEVKNLDRWVGDFLRARDFGRQIVFDGNDRLTSIWDEAIDRAGLPDGLSREFALDEWRQVIQAKAIEDRQSYFRVLRTGRGTPLDRPKRKALWSVFEMVRARMLAEGLAESDDAYRAAVALRETSPRPLPYDHVIVDETQDMGEQAIRLIRAIVPEGQEDLFFVGDAHQRIYARKASMSACGVNVRGRRSSILRINYRTTEEIRAWAVAILSGQPTDDMDEGVEEASGYRSLMHGEAPEIARLGLRSEELSSFVDWIAASPWRESGSIGVCAYSRRDLDQIGEALNKAGIPFKRLERESDDPDSPGVRIMTMHRAKGLEFDAVCMMHMGAKDFPPQWTRRQGAFPDEAARADEMLRLRSLVHVAATRARHTLRVSVSGAPFWGLS
jgi:superfamily I DNA/RNA helicase